MNLSFAQQNEEFKKIKEYYDYRKSALNNSFKKRFDDEQDTLTKIFIKNDFVEFMKKMDSIQNIALISALIKVKNREDLAKAKMGSFPRTNENLVGKEVATPAAYPGGIEMLRNQVASLLYFDVDNLQNKILKSNVAFVVDKDGGVSFVTAEGDNFIFNRQAEIAVYLLSDKFYPAKINGENVEWLFRFPLTINFE